MVNSKKSVITINYFFPLIVLLVGIVIDIFVNLTNIMYCLRQILIN